MGNLIAALEKRGFSAVSLRCAEEVKSYLLSEIDTHSSVGIGGSVTIEQLGVYDDLLQRGNRVYWHWKSPEDMITARAKASVSDVYLCSVNAVLTDGRLLNIDGTGNRLAATLWGPKHVYIVIGKNKIVEGGIEEGLDRIRSEACPQNARRLGFKTPCAITGKCNDCNSPNRMCSAITILERKPGSHPITVLMVDEKLGF